jgi:hypothetical protein
VTSWHANRRPPLKATNRPWRGAADRVESRRQLFLAQTDASFNTARGFFKGIPSMTTFYSLLDLLSIIHVLDAYAPASVTTFPADAIRLVQHASLFRVGAVR